MTSQRSILLYTNPYNNIECNIIAAQNAIGCFFAILIIGCAIARIRPKIKITNFFRYLYINLTDLSAKVLNVESLLPCPLRTSEKSFSLLALSNLPGNSPLRKSNTLLTNFIIKNQLIRVFRGKTDLINTVGF